MVSSVDEAENNAKRRLLLSWRWIQSNLWPQGLKASKDSSLAIQGSCSPESSDSAFQPGTNKYQVVDHVSDGKVGQFTMVRIKIRNPVPILVVWPGPNTWFKFVTGWYVSNAVTRTFESTAEWPPKPEGVQLVCTMRSRTSLENLSSSRWSHGRTSYRTHYDVNLVLFLRSLTGIWSCHLFKFIRLHLYVNCFKIYHLTSSIPSHPLV